jgi:hypothetical protein
VKERQFFIVTMQRAENVDAENPLRDVVETLGLLHHRFGFPVLGSLRPRTRSKAIQFGIDFPLHVEDAFEAQLVLVFEASRSALHAILHQVRADELDHTSIVVAISEVVIKGRKAMLLTRVLHPGQLLCFELMPINVPQS